MGEYKRKDLVSSPKSISMKSSFGDLYNKKEVEEYDFSSNKYVKSTSRVQDLINKYNKPITKKKETNSAFNAMNPINVLYTPKHIPTRDFDILKSSSPRNSPSPFYNTNKIPVTGRNMTYSTKSETNYSFDRPRNSVHPHLDSFTKNVISSKNFPVNNFSDNMSTRSHRDIQESSTDSCPLYSTYYNRVSSPVTDTSAKDALYGPSVELTLPLSFKILNSIYSFKRGVDTSVYFIEVSSNISWIIKKSIKSIIDLLDNSVVSSNGLDKPVRDNMITTMLNRFPINQQLQYFILTDITKSVIYRGDYLLYNNVPYIYKLVGKALVSYNMSNRVHRLFILDQCKVECGRNDYSFFVRTNQGSVELYASCKVERDEWLRDIEMFIGSKM